MKVCKKCQIEKEETDFYKGDAKCKSCKIDYQKKHTELNKEKIREYKKNYASKNSEKIKSESKQYYENNKDLIKERVSNNYHKDPEKKLEYQRKYAKDNKEKISEYKRIYQRKRRTEDTIFKLKHSISRMIRNSLKNNGFIKYKRSNEILGCSIEELRIILESKFDESMTWENYGIIWDIDHIVPLSTAKTEEDVIRLNHYTNLQPLDRYINRNIKRDRTDFYNK
jgi:hypothetical protein